MANELNPDSSGLHSVTAFFEQREAAERARADLLAAGFPDEDVRFISGAEAAQSAPTGQQGILKSLLDIFVFMPSNDQLSYAEGLRRGGMALVVRTGRDGYERAIDILDRDGAIDLDEREQTWRGEGWTKASRPGGPGSPDQAGFESANRHDPLVNKAANTDMRERIGVGTSDMTVGTDLDPPSAATAAARSPEVETDRPVIVRDNSHGRRRIRSYVRAEGNMPRGIDPQI